MTYISEANPIEYILFGTVVFFNDSNKELKYQIPDLIANLGNLLPYELFSNSIVEEVRIGEWEEFSIYKIDAFYKYGAIFLSNQIESVEEAAKNIVHELAHALESVYSYDIYADSNIRNEFLHKRWSIASNLRTAGIRAPIGFTGETEYSPTIDQFLYNRVGYDKLEQLAAGIYLSPYAITSLSEYWSVAFEVYFIEPENHHILKSICPNAFQKIEELLRSLAEEE